MSRYQPLYILQHVGVSRYRSIVHGIGECETPLRLLHLWKTLLHCNSISKRTHVCIQGDGGLLEQ